MGRPSETESATDSLKEYGRGISGGLLFSIPLLYTMEMWWLGFLSSPRQLLGFLFVTLLLLVGYNRVSGFREDSGWGEIIVDSVDALGIGILTAAAVLWILGRISMDMPFEIVLGKIAVEAGMVAIGISIGTAQLGAEESGDGSGRASSGTATGEQGESGKSGSRKSDSKNKRSNSLALSQVMLAFFGGLAFAANVAPTEEILLIAAEMSFTKLIVLALLSVFVAAAILHFSEFTGSRIHAHAETPFEVVTGVAATYTVALGTAASILWFIGRFEGASLSLVVALTVVLAFPTVLGASAARLLLQAR